MSLPTIDDDQKRQLLDEYNVWEESFNSKGTLVARRLVVPNLGELIYSGLSQRFLTVIDNSEIYRYNGGYYEPDGEQAIRKLVQEFLDRETRETHKNETVGYIKDKNYQKREIFDSNPLLINLKNGVYDLETGKFTEHSPDYFFLNEIPVKYDKDAKIEKIEEFLHQVVKEEDVPLLQEVCGYCLYRKYPIQKAVMLLGEGANGKSTVLSLLTKLLGKKNISSISLQELAESQFACSNLYGKLANIYPDVADKSLYRTGIFKMVTGGDLLTADRKYKDPFNFVNYAKLIFSANKLPESKDDTDAYFRRWIFINFPNRFEGSNCDPYLFDKLSVDEEISGLLNFALEGLKRLLENNAFTNTPSTDGMRESYQRLASPIAAFVMDCVEVSADEFVVKDDLYNAFIDYCSKKNLPGMAKNAFSMRLHEHVRVNDYRPTIGGKRVNAWQGITLEGTTDTKNGGNVSGLSGLFLPFTRAREEVKNSTKNTLTAQTVQTDDKLADFETIKQQHAEWAYNLLMNHPGMPEAFFEREFYSEFGKDFLAHEISRAYKIINKNIEQQGGKTNDEK